MTTITVLANTSIMSYNYLSFFVVRTYKSSLFVLLYQIIKNYWILTPYILKVSNESLSYVNITLYFIGMSSDDKNPGNK